MRAGGGRASPEEGEVLLTTWEENTAGGHGLAVAMGGHPWHRVGVNKSQTWKLSAKRGGQQGPGCIG